MVRSAGGTGKDWSWAQTTQTAQNLLGSRWHQQQEAEINGPAGVSQQSPGFLLDSVEMRTFDKMFLKDGGGQAVGGRGHSPCLEGQGYGGRGGGKEASIGCELW